MSRTLRLTGINLKTAPLGEADRILTILSPEHGLLRLTAPGARKQNSRFGGRSGLFVVNDLLVAKGKSIDKITQAETLESFPGLGRDLGKLTAGQYLAEITLNQALTEQPQADLYYLFTEHLSRIEQATSEEVLPCLIQAIYQLLALSGVAPQVQQCCISNTVLRPDLDDADWQIGFSIEAGGAISLLALSQQLAHLETQQQAVKDGHLDDRDLDLVREAIGAYRVVAIEHLPSRPSRHGMGRHPDNHHASPHNHASRHSGYSQKPQAQTMLLVNAIELYLMQQLAQESLPQLSDNTGFSGETIQAAWLKIERILRQYSQFHCDRPIRSATLIDRCFAIPPHPL
jgi:DNA repair protein RecO (recombination protein O)